MKTSIIILFLFINIAISEIVDGPANVRHKPNGKLKIQLNDSTWLYAKELEQDWFNIMVTAFVRSEDIINDCYLKNGTVLYYKDFKTSKGKTLDTVNVCSWYQDVYKYPNYYEVMIHGYTHSVNIHTESIIEREIEEVINNPDISALKKVLKKFKISEYQIENYSVYTYAEWSDPWATCDIDYGYF